jgi:hypothetical protein
VASNPTPRPWWWLAELTGRTHGTDLIDCPWCGGPSELVPWHPSSSVHGSADPDCSATAGIAFARACCLFGHWFIVPAEAPAPDECAGLTPHAGPCERGRR